MLNSLASVFSAQLVIPVPCKLSSRQVLDDTTFLVQSATFSMQHTRVVGSDEATPVRLLAASMTTIIRDTLCLFNVLIIQITHSSSACDVTDHITFTCRIG